MFSPLNEIENQNQTKPKVSYAWIHESSITQDLSWNLSLNAAWLPTFPNRLCSEYVYIWRENKTRKRGEKKWKFDEVFRVSSNSVHHQCVITSAPALALAPATEEKNNTNSTQSIHCCHLTFKSLFVDLCLFCPPHSRSKVNLHHKHAIFSSNILNKQIHWKGVDWINICLIYWIHGPISKHNGTS